MITVEVGQARQRDDLKSMTKVTVSVDVLSSEAVKVAQDLLAAANERITRTVKEPF